MEDGEVGIDADVADKVLFVCQFAFFQAHGDFHRMVHEVAVHFIEDVVAVKIVEPGIFHPFGDEIALVVHGVGVVDVAFLDGKFRAVAHDVRCYQAVFNDMAYLVDAIRFGGVDVIGDPDKPFSFLGLHVMRDFGVEIPDIVEVACHLNGGIVGLRLVVIDGLFAEVFVEPFPNRAFWMALLHVVKPEWNVGLESAFVRFERDVVRDT